MDNLKILSDSRGKIKIAALDHRGSLKKILNPENPDNTTEDEILNWKRRMVELYKNEVTGILIDPVFGKALVDKQASCGWLLSMEQTGYRGNKEARVTELLPNWSVAQAKEMGASGVKLLLYYDPENEELATKQREVAKQVAEQCDQEEMIFLLEPLSYKIESSREREVLEIAQELKDVDADIFKFEFPGTKNGCEQITRIVDKSWVLLSAGMKYDKYKEALKIAMESGASGFAVGRAMWQEFGDYQGEEREKYFEEVALPRMRELVEIVDNA